MMSGGISNLGMGYDPQRLASQAVVSPDEIAAQQRAQAQAVAVPIAPQTPQSYLDSLIGQQQQALQAYYQSNGIDWKADDPYNHTAQIMRDSLQGQGTINPAMGNILGDNVLGTNFYQQYKDYAGGQYGMSAGGAVGGDINAPAGGGTGTPGAYNTLYADYRKQMDAYNGTQAANAAAAQAADQQRQQNQQLQQQAFNQQTGGGFAGGLLNPSYSQPFGNTLGFSGGMMGSGQAPAASTGLNAWMPQGTGSSPSAGNSGAWGGPFSNKNPWSLG